jgi:hypothetical protein
MLMAQGWTLAQILRRRRPPTAASIALTSTAASIVAIPLARSHASAEHIV